MARCKINNSKTTDGLITRSFIDSASIHGAIAALHQGRNSKIPVWDCNSLLETTYVLLQAQSVIVPGPSKYSGASGLFRYVVTAIPNLESQNYQFEAAEKKTRLWLGRHHNILSCAWKQNILHPNYQEWALTQRRLFWFHHVRMYGDLFNKEYIPVISRIIDCTPNDLEQVHNLSTDPRMAKIWAKKEHLPEDGSLAEKGWLLASLIRGKYHEFLAEQSQNHILSHPSRKGIERNLAIAGTQHVINSEEYFVKMIIGVSLIETSVERRVQVWSDAIAKARQAIEIGKITLPDATDQNDAERHAANAAQAIGLHGSPAIFRRALDITSAIGLGVLLALIVKPWEVGLLGPVFTQGYRYFSGVSGGDDISKLLFSTKRRFRTLAQSVPGRIDRRIV